MLFFIFGLVVAVLFVKVSLTFQLIFIVEMNFNSLSLSTSSLSLSIGALSVARYSLHSADILNCIQTDTHTQKMRKSSQDTLPNIDVRRCMNCVGPQKYPILFLLPRHINISKISDWKSQTKSKKKIKYGFVRFSVKFAKLA